MTTKKKLQDKPTSIRLPQKLHQTIEKIARKKQLTRSTLIRMILSDYAIAHSQWKI